MVIIRYGGGAISGPSGGIRFTNELAVPSSSCHALFTRIKNFASYLNVPQSQAPPQLAKWVGSREGRRGRTSNIVLFLRYKFEGVQQSREGLGLSKGRRFPNETDYN